MMSGAKSVERLIKNHENPLRIERSGGVERISVELGLGLVRDRLRHRFGSDRLRHRFGSDRVRHRFGSERVRHRFGSEGLRRGLDSDGLRYRLGLGSEGLRLRCDRLRCLRDGLRAAPEQPAKEATARFGL
jgi:hypothetical protein